MLENLRDKIQTVQSDLSQSLRGLAISSEAKDEVRAKLGISTNSARYNVTKSRVNVNAGADLLNHYQHHWQRIHKRSEDNAKLADNVGAAIDYIDTCSRRQYSAINELMSQLLLLPESISVIECDLNLAKKQIIQLEDHLKVLVERREAEEFERLKLDHHYKISVYGERKASEFEALKVKLALEHSEKVQLHEKEQQNILKERQQAFQAAFEQELNLYKTEGKIARKDVVLPENYVSNKRASIEEILIEEEESDKLALNEFLNDIDVDVDDSGEQHS